MEHKIFKTTIGDKEVEVEVGKLAEQTNGACTIKCGDTIVFVEATASKEPRDGIDFFPLSIEFEEKLYALGRLPGGFLKREGKTTDKAILTCRLIDRPLRPLFPKGYRNDVQIVAMPLSIEEEIEPDVLAMIGSSIALSISDIPFMGPTGSVVVGLIEGELVINPTKTQAGKSDLHLTVAGTKDAVLMVEAGANEIPEDKMLEAIMFAHEEIKKIVEFQEKMVQEVGKEKIQPTLMLPDEELEQKVVAFAKDKIAEAVMTTEKQTREKNVDAVKEATFEHFAEEYPDDKKMIDEILYKVLKKAVRSRILNDGVRPDGRNTKEIRQLSSEVSLLPRTHGSGLFKRGQTQVMTICTLAPLSETQKLDNIWNDENKRYIHQYNFPGYSVGETKPMRGPGRREIGHGALAERALVPVLPTEADFPYTIRVVSEVMSSNGSTSQASICGSTLSLMDAGVPLKAPVAGIAMGLIKDEESDNVVVLTDIQGLEDFLGDMDFKVAGTSKGITAIQMDIKIKGINKDILETALAQAFEGRMHIMKNMQEAIEVPRQELSQYAPRTVSMSIDPDKIRTVIGPGGKTINGIIDETNVKIDIDDDGSVLIYSEDGESAEKAEKMINDLVKEVEAGETYTGTVTRIMDFGAFVEVLPGKEGLVHISKLAYERVEKVTDVLNVGDTVDVKVTEIDSQGRINLSRKALLEKPEGYVEPERKPRANTQNRRYNNRRPKRD